MFVVISLIKLKKIAKLKNKLLFIIVSFLNNINRLVFHQTLMFVQKYSN
jgi:hypothetical protein